MAARVRLSPSFSLFLHAARSAPRAFFVSLSIRLPPERGVLLRSPSLVVGSDDPPMIGRCGRSSAAVRASRAERFSRAEARTRGETPKIRRITNLGQTPTARRRLSDVSRSRRNLGEKRKKREPADVSPREGETEVSPARDSSSPPPPVTPG